MNLLAALVALIFGRLGDVDWAGEIVVFERLSRLVNAPRGL